MKIEGNHAYFSSEFPKLRIKMNYSTPSFAGRPLVQPIVENPQLRAPTKAPKSF